jgi:hypothetical protein
VIFNSITFPKLAKKRHYSAPSPPYGPKLCLCMVTIVPDIRPPIKAMYLATKLQTLSSWSAVDSPFSTELAPIWRTKRQLFLRHPPAQGRLLVPAQGRLVRLLRRLTMAPVSLELRILGLKLLSRAGRGIFNCFFKMSEICRNI